VTRRLDLGYEPGTAGAVAYTRARDSHRRRLRPIDSLARAPACATGAPTTANRRPPGPDRQIRSPASRPDSRGSDFVLDHGRRDCSGTARTPSRSMEPSDSRNTTPPLSGVRVPASRGAASLHGLRVTLNGLRQRTKSGARLFSPRACSDGDSPLSLSPTSRRSERVRTSWVRCRVCS